MAAEGRQSQGGQPPGSWLRELGGRDTWGKLTSLPNTVREAPSIYGLSRKSLHCYSSPVFPRGGRGLLSQVQDKAHNLELCPHPVPTTHRCQGHGVGW